jgi:hypothetical protein
MSRATKAGNNFFIGPKLPQLQHIEVRVGEKLDFNQERITEDLSGDKRLVQVSPLTLFALDLAAEARNVYVPQHTPRIRPPQCLVWSIWHSDSYETWFPWPSIGASSPTELAKRAEERSKAIINLDTDEVAEWVDGVAFVWIRLHLIWLGEIESQLPPAPESNMLMDEAWSQLCGALRSGKSKAYSASWFKTELPLLTAPEYGLSEKRRSELLKALSGADTPPAEWHHSRERSLREAKRFPRGQAPEDLFEVFTGYQDTIDAPEHRVNRLRQEIADVFPNSPWTEIEALMKP